MALSAGDMDLVQQLEEVGRELPHCPTDATQLLPLLNRVDVLLSRVDQSPSQELLDACLVVMKLMVDDRFLRHSDTDVKVHIASCECELTRITAPVAPYDDEKMKETFQLIVSSFRGLSDMSDRSYAKRTSILDNVARIKSSVVMLDLELDSLIVEMFGHFLDSIRDYHPPPIFSYMESIMTLVIEESEDVSLELLTLILDALKKNDDDPIISRKLGEKVLENCAAKVKPYLLQAVKSLGGAVSQYGAIVTGLCEEASVLEHGDDNDSMNQLNKAYVETPVNVPVLVVPVNESSPLLDVNVNKDSRVEVGAETSIQEEKDKESQKCVDTLASSDNEKEVSRVSSPKQLENNVTDVSEFPEGHPDKSLCSKENLTEATPSVQPVDIEASDTNHDLDGKQQENCDKKKNNSIQKEEHITDKKVKEDALTGNLASTDAPKRSVGSDVKTQKRSKKKMINSASKTPCDLESSKGADRAFNVSITRQKRSKRRPVNIAQEDLQLEEMAQGDMQQEEMAQGDMQREEMAQEDPNQEKLGQDATTEKCSGKRTTTVTPIDENMEETTSDSETKLLIMAFKEIALSSKKGKKNSNQPKAETLKKEMTSNQPKVEIVRKEKGKDQTGGSEKGDGLGDTKAAVKEGEKESVATEPEEKLTEYVKKGKRGNDAHAEKEENTQGTISSKGKKRSGDSDADTELLTESAKKRQKTDLKKKPTKQSAKKGDIKTFLGRIGTSADDPKQETNSSKGKKSNLESEPNSEVKKSGKKAKKGTGTSEPEEESIEQYFPHRVSRQFGLDQDIPSHVIRSNESRQSAWRNYDRPVRGVKLYIPPTLVKPDVSCRYMDWWKGYVFSDKSENGCIQNENHIANGDAKTSSTPGFLSESVEKISEDCGDEDNLTIAQLLNRKRNTGSSKKTKGADDEPVLSDGSLTGCCRTAKESKPTNESVEFSVSSSNKSNKRKLTTGCTTEQEETTVVIEGNYPDESNIEIVKESNKGKSSTGCTKVQEKVAVVSEDNHPDESNVEIEKEGFGNTTEKQLEAEDCAVASKTKCLEADIINIDDDIFDDTALELLHSRLETRTSRLEKIIGAYYWCKVWC